MKKLTKALLMAVAIPFVALAQTTRPVAIEEESCFGKIHLDRNVYSIADPLGVQAIHDLEKRKLDESAIYPEWTESQDGYYQEGDIVTYKGKLYRVYDGTSLAGSPTENPAAWESITVKQLLGEYVRIDELQQGIKFNNMSVTNLTINGRRPSLEGHTHTLSQIDDLSGLWSIPGAHDAATNAIAQIEAANDLPTVKTALIQFLNNFKKPNQ